MKTTLVEQIIFADDGTLTRAFDFRHYEGGMVHIPNGWTAANMGFQVSPTQGGTFDILRDSAGAPVQIGTIKTDGPRWYSLPTTLFGAAWVKLWSKSGTAATETDVQQAGGPLTLSLLLKAQ